MTESIISIGGVADDTGDVAVGAAELAVCRSLLQGGSKSFFAASYFLPARIAEPAAALYAFCRVADDAVDSGDGRQGLEMLRERLERVYAGRPVGHPADRAFTVVVEQMEIPRALPEALLEGFAWDVEGRRYDSLSHVVAYGARVAGAVGAMMTLVMGRRDEAVLARACDLGVAMQLTNIARDVGEDAANGRLYLPREWLAAAGIDAEAWLAQPAFCPALGDVVRRLLRTASLLYRRAASGIACLPRRCRPGIHAARLLYAEIGNELARRGLDSVTQRAVVPGARKAMLCADALMAACGSGATRLDAPPLAETQFLVDACTSDARLAPRRPEDVVMTTERLLEASLERDVRGLRWVLDLFTRLESRDRQGLAGVTEVVPGAAAID